MNLLTPDEKTAIALLSDAKSVSEYIVDLCERYVEDRHIYRPQMFFFSYKWLNKHYATKYICCLPMCYKYFSTGGYSWDAFTPYMFLHFQSHAGIDSTIRQIQHAIACLPIQDSSQYLTYESSREALVSDLSRYIFDKNAGIRRLYSHLRLLRLVTHPLELFNTSVIDRYTQLKRLI